MASPDPVMLRPVPAAQEEQARQAPHDVEVEQALLGAILVNNDALGRVDDILKPEHFYAQLHARMYDAMRVIIGGGGTVTPLTLKMHFSQDVAFLDAGGHAYAVKLVEECPAVINAVEYARLIADLHARRELMRIGEEIVLTAQEPTLEMSPQEQIEEAEKALYTISEKGRYGGGFMALGTALEGAVRAAEAAHKRGSQTTGVATGFKLMDWMLGGLQPSDLVIIAGRPGMGKTALATNIAVHAARARLDNPEQGAIVAFFSLEMSAVQLATRIMAEMAQIPADKIRRGKVEEEKFYDLVEAVRLIENLPLHIDDSPSLSIAQIAARARRMKRDKNRGLGLIVIDYLQLVEPAGHKRQENRVQEITEITKGLKALAKELNVPVLALSQLNRGVDARDDKRPVLSDLRESGSIEQDADVVMFVYREEYYLKTREPDMSDAKKYADWKARSERAHGKADVLIEKHRHGPTGVVPLAFNGELTRFDNLAREEDAAYLNG